MLVTEVTATANMEKIFLQKYIPPTRFAYSPSQWRSPYTEMLLLLRCISLKRQSLNFQIHPQPKRQQLFSILISYRDEGIFCGLNKPAKV